MVPLIARTKAALAAPTRSSRMLLCQPLLRFRPQRRAAALSGNRLHRLAVVASITHDVNRRSLLAALGLERARIGQVVVVDTSGDHAVARLATAARAAPLALGSLSLTLEAHR